MVAVFQQVFLLMLFGVVGYILCKTGVADSNHTKLLSCLEVYVFLPAMLFNTFSTSFTVTYIREKYSVIGISVIILTLLVLFAKITSRIFTNNEYQRKVFQYSLTIPNYGYMGYALAGSLFDSEVLLTVMVFALPISLFTYTVGYCMLTKTQISVKKLLNPVIIAVLIGAIAGLCSLKLPDVFNVFLEKASGCMAPVSMLLAGMVISEFNFKSLLSDFKNYIVVALRLLVIPSAIAMLLKLFSLNEMIIPSLMIYAMPCGLNTIVFPKLIGEDCETGASLAFISSVLSCATIPLILFIFN